MYFHPACRRARRLVRIRGEARRDTSRWRPSCHCRNQLGCVLIMGMEHDDDVCPCGQREAVAQVFGSPRGPRFSGCTSTCVFDSVRGGARHSRSGPTARASTPSRDQNLTCVLDLLRVVTGSCVMLPSPPSRPERPPPRIDGEHARIDQALLDHQLTEEM